MGNIFTYSGITTKIRAMQGRLINDREFAEISALGSVSEVVVYLKKHPGYRKLFENMNEAELHRGQIEKMIVESVYEDYAKLYKFASIKQRRFMEFYFKRYEILVLKSCFRTLLNNYEPKLNLSHTQEYFDRFSGIDLKAVIMSRTLSELMDNLRGTEYERPLSRLLTLENPTLFDFEITLDLYHFSSIWKEKNKILKGEDLEILMKSLGSRIDLLNIQWIYRARHFYHMEAAEVYALIIPLHYKLRRSTLSGLIESESPEQFAEVLKGTRYAGGYDYYDGEILEQLYGEMIRKIYITDQKRNPYSIATINAYLYQKGLEIRKLTTVLECIRYGLSPGETLTYVGGVI